MTEYTDIAQVNILYQQSQQVAAAINNLDAGGTMSSVTVAPAPPPEGSMGMMAMAVSIAVPGPVDPALLVTLRAALVALENDIAAQLQALGVTATPPAHV